jgi:hypothetical protein
MQMTVSKAIAKRIEASSSSTSRQRPLVSLCSDRSAIVDMDGQTFRGIRQNDGQQKAGCVPAAGVG